MKPNTPAGTSTEPAFSLPDVGWAEVDGTHVRVLGGCVLSAVPVRVHRIVGERPEARTWTGHLDGDLVLAETGDVERLKAALEALAGNRP